MSQSKRLLALAGVVSICTGTVVLAPILSPQAVVTAQQSQPGESGGAAGEGVTDRAVPSMVAPGVAPLSQPAGKVTAATPVPGVKTLRHATTGPSPEEERVRRLPQAPSPDQLREPTKAEMQQRCLDNPRCRQKMETIQKGGKLPVLPAATGPSPEEQELKRLLPPGQGIVPPGPHSNAVPRALEQLFAWLNPFAVAVVEAQSAYSVTLTPAQSITNPMTWMGIYGFHGPYVHTVNGDYSFTYGSSTTAAENKPYIYFQTSLPAQGLYLIDIAASPAFAKLRHQSNGPVLDTWDYRTVGCVNNVCHYATIDTYAAGSQNWYFWSSAGNCAIYSVTIKSFP